MFMRSVKLHCFSLFLQKSVSTLGDRLQPTMDEAEDERKRFELIGTSNSLKVCNYWFSQSRVAFKTGWALNIAIGAQVVVGALVTILSAVLTGKTVGHVHYCFCAS